MPSNYISTFWNQSQVQQTITVPIIHISDFCQNCGLLLLLWGLNLNINAYFLLFKEKQGSQDFSRKKNLDAIIQDVKYF